MNDLQMFNNQEFGQIRTLVIDNEPWFVGKDVATALGYSNSRKALIDHVDNEDKDVTKCDTPGGSQKLIVINESGLYCLILSSKLPSAKKFKRWVTSEVLPAIRKTGSYSVGKLPPVRNLKEVVNYISLMRDVAKQNNCNSTEVSTVVESLANQFGVILPRCFTHPATSEELSDMVDYVFSQPRGKGHKRPTFETYVAVHTVHAAEMLECEEAKMHEKRI